MIAIASIATTTSASVTGAGTPSRLPTPVEAREFGEQRAEAGDDQGRDRKPRPAAAEMLLDQRGVALAGHGAEADGQLLDDVEDRNQDDLQKQQAVAPLRAALRRGDDAARVGVGEHDDDARAGDGEKAPPVEGGGRKGVGGHRGAAFGADGASSGC